jgi:integrase
VSVKYPLYIKKGDKEVSEQVSIEAYHNFAQTCRSPSTRRIYEIGLHNFMDFLKISDNAYDKLVDKDHKLIQMDICAFITYLRQKNCSSSSVSTYLSGIRHFYDINGIDLHWKRIHKFEGEKEKPAEDRPYTHSEIKLLLEHTILRNRAIILLMASSGPRVGALRYIRTKDLEPIDKYKIYKITYYPHSKKDRYVSYCTPEARAEIDSYLDYRKRWGERLRDDTPLFRKDYDAHESLTSPVIALSENRMRNLILKICRDCGLRGVNGFEGNRYQRTNIMANHGLRKFFETNCFRGGMNREYIRRLLGQKGGSSILEDAYLKLSEEELLEGDNRHVGYIGVIDQLTISDEHRVKRENEILKIRADKVDGVLAEIAEIRQQLGLE